MCCYSIVRLYRVGGLYRCVRFNIGIDVNMVQKVRCPRHCYLVPRLCKRVSMNVSSEPPAFDIVARIAERAPELRSAERKVAALILDDLTGASRASIGALAKKAEVSVATVTRFAKAVGCRDVRELKLRLAQAAAVGQRFLQPGGPSDAPEPIATRVFDELQTALAHNHQLLRQA